MAEQEQNGNGGDQPSFNFQPLKKIDLDLFAPAPQVKKMSRKDKMLLRQKMEIAKRSGKKPDISLEKNPTDLFSTVFSTEEAENEISAMEKKKKGKPQILRHALHKNEDEDNRTVFVGNISNTTERKDVKSIFKDCGEIESVRIRCLVLDEHSEKDKKVGRAIRVLRGELKKDERASAAAYVLFRNKESVEKALEKNSILFNGHHIVVTRVGMEDSAYPPETSIFLGNVAYDTTEEDIWNFFAVHGIHNIKRVRLIRDRDSGKCKGFGYVEFLSASTVKKAIETRGNLLNGRELRIVHANKSKAAQNAKVSRRDIRKSKDVDEKSNRKKRARSDTSERSEKKQKTEDVMPWMGMVTNPRRKIPRDLRPLVDGKRDRPKVAHAPVKRKMRNPEK